MRLQFILVKGEKSFVTKVVGIDLFCGIGGLTNGLVQSNIEIRAGFDIDETCRKSFSQKNNGFPDFVCGDIKKLGEQDFKKYFSDLKQDDYKLIAGCAPCQPYSSYQKNKDFKSRSNHKSYGLIEEYLRVVKIVEPDFVVMENVRLLIKDDVFLNQFVEYFRENNFHVDYKVVNMADYGAPQRRMRLLFLAVNKKTVKNFRDFVVHKKIKNVNKKTVFDTIGYLPKINNGEINKTDFLHQSSKLSDLNLKRIKNSREGGTWRDWPKDILPDCYKRESGSTYSSVYGRMKKHDVSPTLTTQFNRYGTGRYGHYEQDRAISLREGALLQTFPVDYEFDSSLGTTVIARQIGNAVPPIYAKVLGEMILDNLKMVKKNEW